MPPDARLLRRAALTPPERELLSAPWYHNFAPFGVVTADSTSSHQRNQREKQPRIFELIDKAIVRCASAGGGADGLELFCADGFYATYALRSGAGSMLGVDLDEGELAKARLMLKLLGYDERCRFERRDVRELEGSYEFAICAGGLYHLEDPRGLLVALRSHVRTALVIQTVFSLANEAPSYFESPAPGWSWGCRFSFDYLLRMVQSAGWEICESSTSVLEGNSRPQDRGSAYLLCVPRKEFVEVENWEELLAEVDLCTEHRKQTPRPELELARGAAVFSGRPSYTLLRHSLHPNGSQVHTHATRLLLEPLFFPIILQHRTVLDLGGDGGMFGFWAAQEGAERVTYIDVNSQRVEMVRQAARHLDFANVDAHEASLDTWDEPADIVLAFASTYAGGRSGDVDSLVEKLASLTNYLLIVEGMGPENPAFDSSRGGEQESAEPYVDEELFSALESRFRRVERLGDVCPTHRLYAAYRVEREIQLGWPLPFVLPASSVVSGRLLATVDGVDYCSRVYVDREGGRVVKQTTVDLAEREYRFLSRLSGDYFPRPLAFRKDESQSILEMELVEGTPLVDYRDEVTATLGGTTEFFLDCLSILEELDKSGIKHRDIIPGNILVRSGKPVLIDFGWAISDDMPYVTPSDLDPDGEKSDVFGMGRVLQWVNAAKYPELDLVVGLMVQNDPALRVSDPVLLARLLRTVATRARTGCPEGAA